MSVVVFHRAIETADWLSAITASYLENISLVYYELGILRGYTLSALRPTVSFINSPLYIISKHIAKTLAPLAGRNDLTVKNPYNFMFKKLSCVMFVLSLKKFYWPDIKSHWPQPRLVITLFMTMSVCYHLMLCFCLRKSKLSYHLKRPGSGFICKTCSRFDSNP